MDYIPKAEENVKTNAKSFYGPQGEVSECTLFSNKYLATWFTRAVMIARSN